MRRLPQSTAYTIMLKVFLSTDHSTPATGKTVAIVISKAGAAFANPNAGASNMTEVSNGWYKFALATQDTDTLGDLVFRATATGCDDAEDRAQVVNAATGGLTNLDAAISAEKTKTDNLPSDPADASDIAAAFSTVNSTLATIAGYVDTEVAAIKAKTDNLPTDPADASDIAAAFTALQSHGDGAWATATGFAVAGDIPSTSDIATAVAAQALNAIIVMVNNV